jgi:hypothetical protein
MATNNLRNFENNVKNNKKNYNEYANKLLNIVRKFETNQNKIEKIHKSINALAGRFKNAHGSRVGNKKLAVIVNGKVEYPIRAWGKLLQKQNKALITQTTAATKVEKVLVDPTAANVTQAKNINNKAREAAEAAAKAAGALKNSVNNAGKRVGRPGRFAGAASNFITQRGVVKEMRPTFNSIKRTNNNANTPGQVTNPLFNSKASNNAKALNNNLRNKLALARANQNNNNAVNNLAKQVGGIPTAAANVLNNNGTPNAAANAANRMFIAAKNNAKRLKQNNNNANVNKVVTELVNNAAKVNNAVVGAINAKVNGNTARKNSNLNKMNTAMNNARKGLKMVNRGEPQTESQKRAANNFAAIRAAKNRA